MAEPLLSSYVTTGPEKASTEDATSADSGTSGAEPVRCQRCDWEGDRTGTGKGQCPRCGCFLPSNRVALKHGARRLQSGRGTPLDQKRVAEIEAAVIEDLGGPEAVTEVRAALVRDFAFAVVLRDLLSAHLAAVGPLTSAGKKRAALGTWHRASARVEALSKRIGVDRVSRPTRSLQEAWTAAPRIRPESDERGGTEVGGTAR